MTTMEDTPFVIDFKPNNQTNYGTTNSNDNDFADQLGNKADYVPNVNANTETPSTSKGNRNNREIRKRPTLYCLYGLPNVEVQDHCHRQRSEGVDFGARKKLIIASALCLFFMLCEIVGGVLSNSLAIATDAAHLLTDFASFMISLFAIWLAGRPSTQRMSFGWYRAEVIGAMASVVMIWVITAILVWLAIQRVITGEFEVDADIMLITSALAILVNLIMAFQLHHGHGSHGGHGHSHGGAAPAAIKKPKHKLKVLFDSKTKKATDTGKTNHALDLKCDETTENAYCPNSPTERLEDGVTTAGVDAQLPAAGLQTFSYQNSKSVDEVQTEMAAVMAETSAGSHHHGKEAAADAINMNVRAAIIHVIGDFLQSLGVFFAALIIWFRPDWAIADPICTFIFSIIVLFTTFAIMKDALLVLMEGTPNYMHYEDVYNVFKQIEGVERVHNLRIWGLSINKVALSVHLAIAPDADPKKILQEATRAVHLRFNFFETTIQIEDFVPDMDSCTQCTVPEK